MGQRQDQDEIIYGDDCVWCFASGQTPKYVYARFSNIVNCPPGLDPPCPIPPNDHVFKLTQSDIDPCLYIYEANGWKVEFGFNTGVPLESRLFLRDGDGRFHFMGAAEPCADEGTMYHNTIICGDPGGCSSGGIGIVTWRTESITILAALNIKTGYDVFMEMRPLVDGNKVYKYCRLKDATNIAIEYEAD